MKTENRKDYIFAMEFDDLVEDIKHHICIGEKTDIHSLPFDNTYSTKVCYKCSKCNKVWKTPLNNIHHGYGRELYLDSQFETPEKREVIAQSWSR